MSNKINTAEVEQQWQGGVCSLSLMTGGQIGMFRVLSYF